MCQKRLPMLLAVAALGFALLGGCGKPPLVPDTPTGPTSWMKGVALTCSTVTTDPGGSQVSYQFDWGDNTQSQWSAFVDGGVAVGDTHTYADAGNYDIKARAKNKKRASDWSDPLRVSIGVGEGQVLWSMTFVDPFEPDEPDTADFSLGCFGISADKTACKTCTEVGGVVARKSSSGRWDFVTGEDLDYFYGSPVVADDGTIYVGCENGLVYAINSGGTQKWSRDLLSPVNGTAALAADGAVVFQNEDSMVICFGADGSQRWSFPSGGGNSSPAIGTDGTVYLATGDGEIYALDGSVGTTKWQSPYRLSSNSINASLALDPGRSVLYAADEVGLFTAVNLDGTFGWQLSIGDDPSTPVIGADGTVYIGGGGKLWALDPSVQDVKWSITPSIAGLVSTPAVSADGCIYFMVTAGKKDRRLQDVDSLYAVNPDGSPRWSCGLGEGSSDPDYALSSPKIDDNGLIYVGNGTRAWCVVGLSGPAQSVWPMFQRDAQNTGRARAK